MLFRKTFLHERLLKGRPDEYFHVLSDVSKYYIWNPNILHASIDGPFREGTKGMSMPKEYTYSTLTLGEIIPSKKVTLIFKLPLGSVTVCYSLEEDQPDITKVTRETIVRGFPGWTLYLMKAKSFRKNFDATLSALEAQVLKERRQNRGRMHS